MSIKKFSGYTAIIDGSTHNTLKEAEAHTIKVKTEAALKEFAGLTQGEPSGTVGSAALASTGQVVDVVAVADLPKFLLTYKVDILKAFNQVARQRKPRGPNKPKAPAATTEGQNAADKPASAA